MVFTHDEMNVDATEQIRKLGESILLWHDQMEQLKVANCISQRQIGQIRANKCFELCLLAQCDMYERVLSLVPTKEKIKKLIIENHSFIDNKELTELLIGILQAACPLALVSLFPKGYEREIASSFQVQIEKLLTANSLQQKEIQDAIDSRIGCSEEIETKIADNLLKVQESLFGYITSSFPTVQAIENLLETIASQEASSTFLPCCSPDTYCSLLTEITDDYKDCECLRSRYFPQESKG